MSRAAEWPVRRQILDALLDVLADGRPHTARQLVDKLAGRGMVVAKQLVNSVLFSEGRRYVWYDHKRFEYTLSTEGSEIPATLQVTSPSAPPAPALPAPTPARAAAPPTAHASPITLRLAHATYEVRHQTLSTPALFEVDSRGNTLIIVLNCDHPAYAHLAATLAASSDATTISLAAASPTSHHPADQAAARSLLLLLAAWAEYETTEPLGPRRQRVQHARADWGRAARSLLNGDLD